MFRQQPGGVYTVAHAERPQGAPDVGIDGIGGYAQHRGDLFGLVVLIDEPKHRPLFFRERAQLPVEIHRAPRQCPGLYDGRNVTDVYSRSPNTAHALTLILSCNFRKYQ